MKMTRLEKQFVNSLSHSRQVSQHNEKLLKLVDFKAGQKYLDVGCGNGAAPIYLARQYHLDVTGVDVDPDQIRLAEKDATGLRNIRFLTVDGTHLPFGEAEFDIVFTHKVTHHIPAWEVALADMVRVLKPRGYFIYVDLIYPGWVAAAGKMLLKNRGGFPTRAALSRFFQQNDLWPVHLSPSWVQYEAIFQKQARVRG